LVSLGNIAATAMEKTVHSDETLTDLCDSPMIAQWLGCYIAQFSIFDFALLGLYSTVLGKEPEGTLAILGSIDSFSKRLDAIEKYLPLAKLEPSLKERIKRIIPEIRARNSFRNAIVHGMYFQNTKTKRIRVRAFMTSTRRNDAFIDLEDPKTDIMAQEIEKVQYLIGFVARPDLMESNGVPKDIKKALKQYMDD
jgi:hypothetical protein